MELGLRGKVALVAASSSGLGKAAALDLAMEGASVVVNGRNIETTFAASREIASQTGSPVLPIAADVTSETDVTRLVSETLGEFGSIDILVANAGGPPAGHFADFNLSDYREAIELNLLSTVNLCRAVVPIMEKNGWGRIVAITSIAAKQPIDNLILSNTARAGLLGFLKTLSNQVASRGITVNTVCPGYHMTDRLKSLLARRAEEEGRTVEEVGGSLAEQIPARRIGDPSDLASVIAFLCSGRASYVTGTVIQVDGGACKSLL